MADDNKIITITLKLDKGDVDNSAKQAMEAIKSALSGGVDIPVRVQTQSVEQAKQQLAEGARGSLAAHAAGLRAVAEQFSRESVPVRGGGFARVVGGGGDEAGERRGEALTQGVEGLTRTLEGFTKLLEGRALGGGVDIVRGLGGFAGSFAEGGVEAVAGLSLLRRVGARARAASAGELEGVGPLFGTGGRSAMAGALGREAAAGRGEGEKVLGQRLAQLGLGGGEAAGAGELAVEGAGVFGGGYLASRFGAQALGRVILGSLMGGAGGGAEGLMAGPWGALLGGAVGAAAGGYGAYRLVAGAGEAAQTTKELGEEAADTDLRLHRMAETSGLTFERFQVMNRAFEKSGIDVVDLDRSLTRLAVAIPQRMHTISREYADASDVMEESNIKVRDSTRAVDAARDHQAETADKVTEAEAGLAVEQETGVERREEQLQGARLGVGGAQVGVERAQLGMQEARVRLQFAPQEQALADIQGPLRVEGAEVSLAGAQIAASGADIRYRRQHGEYVSQQEIRDQKEAEEAYAVTAAGERARQAAATRDRAVLSEQERLAGPTPTQQARVGYDAAAQQAQQADLAKQVAETNLKTTEMMQTLVPEVIKLNEAQRGLSEAHRNQAGAADELTKATHAQTQATEDQSGAIYQNPEIIERALRGQAPPGFDYARLADNPQLLQDVLVRRGAQRFGGGAGGAIDALVESLQQGPQDLQFGLAATSALLPGLRSFRGGVGIDAYRRFIAAARDPAARRGEGIRGLLTEDDLRDLAPDTAVLDRPDTMARARALEQQRIDEEARARRDRLITLGVPAMEPAAPVAGVEAEVKGVGAQIGGFGLQALNATITGIGNAFSGVVSKVEGGGAAVGGALEAIAAKLSGWAPPTAAPAQTPTEKPSAETPTEAPAKAAGGLISGPGSGTSDSIPIMASDGEYIIRASRVAQLGLPFLDAINGRRFHAGGLIRGFAEGGVIDYGQKYRAWAVKNRRLPDSDAWREAVANGLDPDEALDPHTGYLTAEAARIVDARKSAPTGPAPSPPKTQQDEIDRIEKQRGFGVTNLKDIDLTKPEVAKQMFGASPDVDMRSPEDIADERLRSMHEAVAAAERVSGGHAPKRISVTLPAGAPQVEEFQRRMRPAVSLGPDRTVPKGEPFAVDEGPSAPRRGRRHDDDPRPRDQRPHRPEDEYLDSDDTTLPGGGLYATGGLIPRMQGGGGTGPFITGGPEWLKQAERRIASQVGLDDLGHEFYGDQERIFKQLLFSQAFSMFGPPGTFAWPDIFSGKINVYSAAGGLIRRAGGGGIPALVSNGEYRVNPDAVSHYGVSFFDALNSGRGFADGGAASAGISIFPSGQLLPPLATSTPVLPAASFAISPGITPPSLGLTGVPTTYSSFIQQYLGGGAGLGEGQDIAKGLAQSLEKAMPVQAGGGFGPTPLTHQLDLSTSAGTFSVGVNENTLEAIRASALGSKLTMTGALPSWAS